MSKGIPYRSDYFEADLWDYAPVGMDPWHDPDDMLRACVRSRADDTVSPGAKPPTLALLPIRRELFDPPRPDIQAELEINSGRPLTTYTLATHGRISHLIRLCF